MPTYNVNGQLVVVPDGYKLATDGQAVVQQGTSYNSNAGVVTYPNYRYDPQIPVTNPYVNVNSSVRPTSQPVQEVPKGLVGRMVLSDEEIKPNETPNDGSPAIFVRNDFEEIYLTYRDKEGKIVSTVFVQKPREVPVQNTTTEPAPNNDLDDVKKQLEEIKGMISKQQRSMYYHKQKREVNGNGSK